MNDKGLAQCLPGTGSAGAQHTRHAGHGGRGGQGSQSQAPSQGVHQTLGDSNLWQIRGSRQSWVPRRDPPGYTAQVWKLQLAAAIPFSSRKNVANFLECPSWVYKRHPLPPPGPNLSLMTSLHVPGRGSRELPFLIKHLSARVPSAILAWNLTPARVVRQVSTRDTVLL